MLPAGCAEQQQFKAVKQICAANLKKARAMQIAEDVLGQMYFTIAKADNQQGYIKTRPLAGAQFFEFWRSDNVGAFNTAEANLHSIRRIVELNINQQDGKVCIDCDVKVQRLNLPQRQISSSSQMPGMFSKSRSSLQRLKLYPEQKRAMTWVDLGEDARLETKILKQISSMLETGYRESSIE